ncbi:hypothetical protein KDA14_03205 [Candidatus Saccharibacteria bacterium]|nr:hypothetical protein [Candidatus Saccharibacteria bacterium]
MSFFLSKGVGTTGQEVSYRLDPGGAIPVVLAPYIAFDENNASVRELQRTAVIEQITGLRLVRAMTQNGVGGEVVIDGTSEPTFHMMALDHIRAMEEAGNLPAGTTLECAASMIEGEFDGTVQKMQILPEQQSVKYLLQSMGWDSPT